jgi:excisionase family DNA binding protein
LKQKALSGGRDKTQTCDLLRVNVDVQDMDALEQLGDRPGLERLLTVADVARLLSVSTAWVYDHADRKRPLIPCVRLGKAVRFRPDDVQQFIEAMTGRVA